VPGCFAAKREGSVPLQIKHVDRANRTSQDRLYSIEECEQESPERGRSTLTAFAQALAMHYTSTLVNGNATSVVAHVTF
jgi:hypothetical protein